ncbi:MAG: hypothetical protein QOG89_2185 [Thermomicrobiales bacterium]|nr:hypothetical protein [Thermomicrobiales bacterium]
MGIALPVSSGVDAFLASVPAVFAVVGEHRADPTRLLLLGDDGRFYTYETEDGVPIAVELTPEWIVDAAASTGSRSHAA